MALVTERAEVGNTATPNAGPRSKPRVNEHTCCTQIVCSYLGPDGRSCLKPITCTTVPEHFESHGVKGIPRTAGVICRWEGCFEVCVRHNFVRHIREKHLAHTRGSAACNPDEDRQQQTSFRGEADDAGSRNDPHANEPAISAPQLCQYQDRDGGLCMTEITHATVSNHFATCHGIKAMSRGQPITCRWVGCVNRGLKRHNFVRHIREKHLGQTRGSALRKSEKVRR